MAQLQNTTVSSTGFLQLPTGTTAQRPASPVTGMVRYNATLQDTEYYDGTTWRAISEGYPAATGGTVHDTVIGGIPYRVHSFTTTGNSTFTVTRSGEIEYLIVAGGGSGGSRHAGGGGAGGLLTGFTTVTPQSYTITVGAGGVALFNPGTTTGFNGVNGDNSSAFGLTAVGGGGGGIGAVAPGGGSGGGGGENTGKLGGAGIAGQGNAGGNGNTSNTWGGGGGGGGAGSAGQNAQVRNSVSGGNGGQGITSFIFGVPRFFAGGGGGACYGNSTSLDPLVKNHGVGGVGGGGPGGTALGFPGSPNTGGGGGGGSSNGDATGKGGDGGSGIVVIRYILNEGTTASATTTVSTLPNSSPTEYLVQEGLVLNFDASNPLSYAGSGAVSSYSSTGTVWRNLANPSVNGTINGDITFERAAPNNGRFVFNNSPFVATSNFLLGNGPTAWTVSAWINTTTTVDDLGAGAIASNASGGPVYSSLGVNAGRISYWVYSTSWQRRIGNITVNDGRWHLLTWVNYPNSTMAMYVDGRVDVTNQASGTGNNNPIDRFGGSWTARFDGRISQITINLNRFLTTSEILQFYNSTRWRFGV
jgi:hypothetical protein